MYIYNVCIWLYLLATPEFWPWHVSLMFCFIPFPRRSPSHCDWNSLTDALSRSRGRVVGSKKAAFSFVGKNRMVCQSGWTCPIEVHGLSFNSLKWKNPAWFRRYFWVMFWNLRTWNSGQPVQQSLFVGFLQEAWIGSVLHSLAFGTCCNLTSLMCAMCFKHFWAKRNKICAH